MTPQEMIQTIHGGTAPADTVLEAVRQAIRAAEKLGADSATFGPNHPQTRRCQEALERCWAAVVDSVDELAGGDR